MNPRPGGELWSGDPSVGQRVAQLRVDRGLTLRELSDQAGITNGYLSHVEKSRRAPSLVVMVNLAAALGTTVLFLVTGEVNGECLFCGRDCK